MGVLCPMPCHKLLCCAALRVGVVPCGMCTCCPCGSSVHSSPGWAMLLLVLPFPID